MSLDLMCAHYRDSEGAVVRGGQLGNHPDIPRDNSYKGQVLVGCGAPSYFHSS